MPSSNHYDVVIVGGGLVGTSLALQLNKHGAFSIAVIERSTWTKPDQQQRTARTTALSYSSRLLLEPLGIWPDISAHAAAIDTVHIATGSRYGSMTLTSAEVNWPALGYAIENHQLAAVLRQALQQQSAIRCYNDTCVQRLLPRKQGIDIHCSGQNTNLHAQLVIVADGVQSQLRNQLGIGVTIKDYHQTAIVTTVQCEHPLHHRAYECFSEYGPIALLPLPSTTQQRAALIWVLSTTAAQALMDCSKPAFLSRLQAAFGQRQGRFVQTSQCFSVPLQRVIANEQVRSNIVLMGNAAHTMHPVGGQGFNLALRDGAQLAQHLNAAHASDKPLGALSLLQDYLQQRCRDQRKTVFFADRMATFFGQQSTLINTLCGLGIGVVDMLPQLKQKIVRYVTGQK